jgi:VanZ family protein
VRLESQVIERPHLRFAWVWWLLGWAFVVLTVSDSLEKHPPGVFELASDKVVHFLGYFALALWFAGVTRPRRYPVVGALLIVLGGVLEILQGAMNNGRQAEWNDLFADALGVIAALGLAYAGLGRWAMWIERLLGVQKK